MEVNCVAGGACPPCGHEGHIPTDGAIRSTGNVEYIQDPLIPSFGVRPFEVYCGEALETIRRLKAGGTQFDNVITSPPYFNQRKYGDDPREMGQEKTVGSFITSMVGIFTEIPLRPWGSIWVNIGNKRGPNGDLLGVPDRFVIAMQDAGFFLIDDVIWVKEVVKVDGSAIGHCMVEPAPGRLNGNGWEHFFRFVRNPKKAWSDTHAIQIPRDRERFFHAGTKDPVEQTPYNINMECVTSLEGRNTTNVWYIGNSRHGKGHFAAYPSELVERPIAMTCPEYLVDDCGEIKPRVRIVVPTLYSEGPGKSKRMIGQYTSTVENLKEKSGRMDSGRQYIPKFPKTVGWTLMDKPLVGPGIACDPFGGTGSSGYVAILLGRRFVGIDLYQV